MKISLKPVTDFPSNSASAVNLKDFKNVGQKKKKEMNFDAQFEGITLQLAHRELRIIYTKVSGDETHPSL